MRSLFLLLLIINVCYLIWGVAFSEKEKQIVSSEPLQSYQSLTLLKEGLQNNIDLKMENNIENETVEEKEEKQETVEIEGSQELDEEIIESRLCFSIGPFLEEEKYQIFVKDLLNGNFQPTIKSIKDTEPQSYWVFISAAETNKEAKKTAEQLKAAKVKDYFVVLKGENVNAISLGLFNSYKRAILRKENLTKSGFEVNVETRYADVIRYWVDYQEQDSTPLEDDVWKKADKDNVLQKIARPCVDPLPETG